MGRKRHEFVMTFLLSYVTSGIYGIYVWYDMANNINEVDTTSGETPLMNAWLALLLINTVTCGIFGIFWYIKFFKKLVAIAQTRGIQVAPTDNPVLLWLIMLVPVYGYYVLCEAYNTVVAG